ncbi:hypothetical protein D3C76_1544530 [compost metagenome]
MADAFAILEHHGVHRTDTVRLVRQLIEQRDHRLLAREGDVQPGEAHALGVVQQRRKGVHVQLELVEVDQPVQVADALGVALVLVQGRGARGLDAGADQPGQYGSLLVGHGDQACSRWAKCSMARR